MKIIRGILLLLNIIVATPLLLFFFDLLPSPANSGFIALMPFAFLGLYVANIIFIVIWIFIKWKYMFISIITLIIGVGYISAIIPLPSYFNSKATNGDFKVMSYNVMLFGLYDWNNNEKVKDSIVTLITDESPDILCLQEVYWNSKGGDFNPLDQIKNNYDTIYMYKEAMATAIKNQNFGLATFSKYPIINNFSIKFENSFNGVIVSDILLDSDTVRVFNCHMQSIQLDQNDYTLIENITDTVANDKMKLILKKIIQASQIRASQTDIVADHIRSSPYPVFVCGDLNDFPLSYTYINLLKGLRDTYSYKGKFPGYTWDNFNIKQRIDVIFYDKKYRCKSHKVIKKPFSDHYPIVAEFVSK